MAQKHTAVILNDTSGRYHHGCARVMRLLCAGLERHGLKIIAKSPARHDWENDSAFLAQLAIADVIVINGEGTLHHGKPAGHALLRVTEHPARGTTPVALVNALYQDNPDDWNALLAGCSLLAARDSESCQAMARASGNTVRWLPDLSLSAAADITPMTRSGVIIGDSVKLSARQVLAKAAGKIRNVRFVPTKTLSGFIWRSRLVRAGLYRIYSGVLPLRTPTFHMPKNETAYLREIASAELHITGRFHAVCLSMLVETPFLALSSNASKIERLLKDAGLDGTRIVQAQQLTDPPTTAPFSASEKAAIRVLRQKSADDAEVLFADIAALAAGPKT